jgi:hypothetical protein
MTPHNHNIIIATVRLEGAAAACEGAALASTNKENDGGSAFGAGGAPCASDWRRERDQQWSRRRLFVRIATDPCHVMLERGRSNAKHAP